MKPITTIIRIILTVLWICGSFGAQAADTKLPAACDPRLDWWREARFGLFIHYGPVALIGQEISWSRANSNTNCPNQGKTPVAVYDNLYKQFNPTNFNAADWAGVAKMAGMKYVVLTAKHCDGFLLWDSKVDGYNILATPFKRDLCAELAQAVRQEGLHLGWYFSPMDWRDADFRTKRNSAFVTRMQGELRELLANYGKVDLLWFDYDGREAVYDQAHTYALVKQLQPQIIIDNRLDLGRNQGNRLMLNSNADYYTPEQQIGAYDDQRPWETCMTICRQWSWKPNDQMKSPAEVVNILCRVVGGDGNLLLDVGPMPDGRIEPRQVDVLKEVGAWMSVNGESIYGTRGGPWKPTSAITSTRKGDVVYVQVLKAKGDTIELPALARNIKSASVLGGENIETELVDGKYILHLPEKRGPLATVIKMVLDGSSLTLPALSLPQTGRAFLDAIRQAPSRVEDTHGQPLPATVRLERHWFGDRCVATLRNTGTEPVRVGNIILFDLAQHGLDPATPIYGEGFQKLAQTGGTLEKPVAIGSYPDAKHYRIPEPDGWPTAYGMMTLDLGAGQQVVLGFSSCKKFIGRFSFTKNALRISVDPEDLELSPGETWQLEEFVARAGADRNVLLDRLADDIGRNHPPLPQPPLVDRTGWCTWYAISGAGNQEVITNTAAQFAQSVPALRFIQIDEGYCPALGDWLEPWPKFGNMMATLDGIRAHGKEPGMWLAPFIAQADSKVLNEHPDWFIQDDAGQPFNSAKVGFGGWSHGPWRVLDGTNPKAQEHLEAVFRTMREKWGVTYFKLDANYWGAIRGGKHFDPKATRVEAYRRGMESILRGAGPGAIVLGCNAPIWPSFGLVNAQRTGNDVSRSRDNFIRTARENLNRAWQNGKLWVSDPDCVLLTDGKGPNGLSDNLFQLHATVIHAVGGLVLSGDRANGLAPQQVAMLRKLMPPTGVGARFENVNFEIGRSVVGDRQYLYAFNWSSQPVSRTVHFTGAAQLRDFWTDENLGVHRDRYEIETLPPYSARLLVAEPAR